jgi:hypothetical protein
MKIPQKFNAFPEGSSLYYDDQYYCRFSDTLYLKIDLKNTSMGMFTLNNLTSP